MPAASAFTVNVAGTDVSLAAMDPVAVAGKTVTLTLVSAIAANQTIIVTYTRPVSGSSLRDAADNETTSFGFTMHMGLSPPTLVSATKGSGRDVTVEFRRTAVYPSFKIYRLQTCTSDCDTDASWSTQWTSTTNLPGTVQARLANSAPGKGYKHYRVVAVAGNSWVSNERVINASDHVIPPRLVSATGRGRILTLTYDGVLDSTSVPPATAFQLAGTVVTDVMPIARGAKEIRIVARNTFASGQSWSVTYDPAAAGENPIRNEAGTPADALTNHGITAVSVDGATLVYEIPDQWTVAGEIFSYTFPENTFADTAGSSTTLTYTAAQADGTALPEWLTFTPATRTFSGRPERDATGTTSVRVTATQAGEPVRATDTFDVKVLLTAPISRGTRITGISFSQPANSLYWASGETLKMSVTYENAVAHQGSGTLYMRSPRVQAVVSGNPWGRLCGGDGFTYASGSGTTTLVFNCTVDFAPVTRIHLPANSIPMRGYNVVLTDGGGYIAYVKRSGGFSPHDAYTQTSPGHGQMGPAAVEVLISSPGPDGYWSAGGRVRGFKLPAGDPGIVEYAEDDIEIIVRFSEAVSVSERTGRGQLWLVADLGGLKSGSGTRRFAFDYDPAQTANRGIETDLVFKRMTDPFFGDWNGASAWIHGERYDQEKRTGRVLTVPKSALRTNVIRGDLGDGHAEVRGETSKLLASLHNPAVTRRGVTPCDRTAAVVEALKSAAMVESCAELTPEKLSSIETLALSGSGISSLKTGDFDDLTGLTTLNLSNNALRELPPGILYDLGELTELNLRGNALTALPHGVFDRLTKLTLLYLYDNDLTTLPPGIFDELAALVSLRLYENDLTALPPGIFDELGALNTLWLRNNKLTSLPSGIFDGLSTLMSLLLNGNDLTKLPDDVFETLPKSVRTLNLSDNPDATNPVTFTPVADAGEDQTVSTGASVTLSGTATGPWGDERVTYAWEQVDGANSTTALTGTGAVALNTVTDKPHERTFTAPGSNVTLYFKLVATPVPAPGDASITGMAASNPDWVTVTVGTGSSMQVTAPAVTAVSISAAPGGDNSWDAGDAVDAVLTFDEAVTVDTTNGTPSVVVKLGEHEVEKTAAYVSGSGTTALTFRYTVASGEGPYSEALLEADSLALNGGTLRSTATQADASLAHNEAGQVYLRGIVPDSKDKREDAGPTAAFSNVPATHDGDTAFEVELAFSAESSITSYATVRDALLEVTGATVTRARRQTPGSNAAWVLTVQPDGPGDVTLTLPVRACSEATAVCMAGKPIARAATATIEGPPFVAAFDGAPSEHDGSAFTVNFRISTEPDGLSYATVRDALFAVTGATVTQARRLTPGSNKDWALTVAPDGYGPVTLALKPTTDCDTAPGVCDASGRMLADPLSLTVQGPPTLAVADAEVEEADGAALDFTVTLSRALDEAVTVTYATADGTAAAGADYTAANGTLTFAAGDTQKTVSVTVLDDAHDEENETLTLTLSNPSPARVKLADAEATGTIRNTDLMPAAWAARFGRTVAEQVLEAVDNRMQAARTPGVEVSVAGARLDGQTPAAEASGADEAAAGQPVALADWLRDATDPNAEDPRERTLSDRDLLLGSTFMLTAADDAPGSGGATYSLWGRGAVSSFDGRDDDLTVDGEVVSALLGADWHRGQMLAGLIVGHSSGDGDYHASAGTGMVSSTLTGLYPWGRYALSERLDVWAAAGYGEGRLTLTPDGQDAIRTDLDLWMGAIGLRGALVDGGAGGLSLTSKTDALLVETSTAAVAGLAATTSNVTRLRLAVEGTLPVRLSNGWVVTPSAELGVRHDGGDAETGFGLDVGAGLVWRAERLGLSAEIRGRGLLTHAASGFRDVGLSGSLAWRPSRDERGPSLSLAQTYGGAPSGGAGALLERGTLSGLSAAGAGEGVGALHRQRLEARFGYGVPAFGDAFTWIPEVGVGASETARDYRLGWRLVRVERGSASAGGRLELSLEAMRRESAVDDTAEPEHAVGMRLTAPF